MCGNRVNALLKSRTIAQTVIIQRVKMFVALELEKKIPSSNQISTITKNPNILANLTKTGYFFIKKKRNCRVTKLQNFSGRPQKTTK